MGKYVVENLIKNLINLDIPIKEAKIGILGFTFKENCPDTRNTRVIDIINELQEYGIKPVITDPEADQNEVWEEYKLKLVSLEEITNMDAIIIAVGHDKFVNFRHEDIFKMFKPRGKSKKIIFTWI